MNLKKNKYLASIFVFLSVLLAVYLGLNLQNKKLDIRNRAAATQVNFSIYPSSDNINLNETKSFDVLASFTNGSLSEKLTYLKVVIAFGKDYLYIPAEKYVDTSKSGLRKIIRADGPIAANSTGVINIELGAISPTDGPNTSSPLTIAKIYLSGKSVTSSDQLVTISKAQVVNAQNSNLAVNLGNATYHVIAPTSSPNPSTAMTPAPTLTRFISPTTATPRNSPTPYASNPRNFFSISPIANPKLTPANYSPAQNQTITANQTQNNYLPKNQGKPADSDLYYMPTPTIFLPDYTSPTPSKPPSVFSSIFSFFHNIICGIFRNCK